MNKKNKYFKTQINLYAFLGEIFLPPPPPLLHFPPKNGGGGLHNLHCCNHSNILKSVLVILHGRSNGEPGGDWLFMWIFIYIFTFLKGSPSEF